jgi:hypothetical protein
LSFRIAARNFFSPFFWAHDNTSINSN